MNLSKSDLKVIQLSLLDLENKLNKLAKKSAPIMLNYNDYFRKCLKKTKRVHTKINKLLKEAK